MKAAPVASGRYRTQPPNKRLTGCWGRGRLSSHVFRKGRPRTLTRLWIKQPEDTGGMECRQGDSLPSSPLTPIRPRPDAPV